MALGLDETAATRPVSTEKVTGEFSVAVEITHASLTYMTADGPVDALSDVSLTCISTITYNEYWQVIDGGIPADKLVVFKYEDQGVATLEDGLYARLSRNSPTPHA
jgi:NitT/TauT family transport system substrate-binding protein